MRLNTGEALLDPTQARRIDFHSQMVRAVAATTSTATTTMVTNG